MKNSAANVLRETWLIYKHTKLVKRVHAGRVRAHQRKFLLAIYALRKVRMDQRKLMDNASSIADIGKTQTQMYELVADQASRVDTVERHVHSTHERVEQMHELVGEFNEHLNSLPAYLGHHLASTVLAHLHQQQPPPTSTSMPRQRLFDGSASLFPDEDQQAVEDRRRRFRWQTSGGKSSQSTQCSRSRSPSIAAAATVGDSRGANSSGKAVGSESDDDETSSCGPTVTVPQQQQQQY